VIHNHGDPFRNLSNKKKKKTAIMYKISLTKRDQRLLLQIITKKKKKKKWVRKKTGSDGRRHSREGYGWKESRNFELAGEEVPGRWLVIVVALEVGCLLELDGCRAMLPLASGGSGGSLRCAWTEG
jgi:hypothetical protein